MSRCSFVGKITDNRKLLSLYLENRELSYLNEIMMNSANIIYSTVKNTLIKNGIDGNMADEYYSAAYIAVSDRIKGIKSYDGFDFNFYSFVIFHAKQAVNNELKSQIIRRKNEVSLYDLNEEVQLEEGLTDMSIKLVESEIDLEIMKKVIFSKSAGLSEHQKDYISLFYGLNGDIPMSMVDIAKLRGVTRQNVHLGISGGLKKIRAYIAKNEHENKILRLLNGENIEERKR